MQSRFSIFGNPALRTYLFTGGFLVVCAMLGFAGIAATRQLFVVGCLLLGIMAKRDSPGRHLEVMIILFAFAPFIRRVIDLSAGYDPLATKVSGPMLAMLYPCLDLWKFTTKTGSWRDSGPMMLGFSCMIYGAMIS